jgi:hypothetical protein
VLPFFERKSKKGSGAADAVSTGSSNMGHSQYAILIRSAAHLRKWKDVIQIHNDSRCYSDSESGDSAVGEEIAVWGIANYAAPRDEDVPSGLYLLFGNEGGRHDTVRFILSHKVAGDVVVLPFGEPADWDQTDDIVAVFNWNRDADAMWAEAHSG